MALRLEVNATPLTISPTRKSRPIAQMFAGSLTASVYRGSVRKKLLSESTEYGREEGGA